MSLLRAAWVYAAFVVMLIIAGMWVLLRPSQEAIEPMLPLDRVDTTLGTSKPIDLAISSGLFSNASEELESAVPDASTTAQAVSPPRLVGLAMKLRGSAVALTVDAAGTTHLLKPGEAVDGWTLLALNKFEAEFVKDGTRQTVALDNDTGPNGETSPGTTASANEPRQIRQMGNVP